MAFQSVSQTAAVAEGELPRIEKASEFQAGQTVVVGTYEGTRTNEFGPLHSFRDGDGNLRTIAGSGKLNYLIEKAAGLKGGEVVKIVYLGQDKIQKGEMKGRMAHNFDLLVDTDA